MSDRRNDSLDEILLAFAVEQAHDDATLHRYLQLYPHLSGELIDLSLDLRLQRATEEITMPVNEAWVEASLATFRATSPVQTSVAVADPFAKVSPQDLVSLRRALNVPSGVIQGFSSRLVDTTSVPQWFIDALASGLRSTVYDLRIFMAAPPRLAQGISYKADDAPSVEREKITFEELLKQCKVPDERRRQLLDSQD